MLENALSHLHQAFGHKNTSMSANQKQQLKGCAINPSINSISIDNISNNSTAFKKYEQPAPPLPWITNKNDNDARNLHIVECLSVGCTWIWLIWKQCTTEENAGNKFMNAMCVCAHCILSVGVFVWYALCLKWFLHQNVMGLYTHSFDMGDSVWIF